MSHLWVENTTQFRGVAQVSLELHFMPVCHFPGTSVQPSHEHLAEHHILTGWQSMQWETNQWPTGVWVMSLSEPESCVCTSYTFLRKPTRSSWISEIVSISSPHHLLQLYKSKEYQEGPQKPHQDTVQLGVLVTSHIYSFCLAVASSSRHGGFLSGQFHFSDGRLGNWLGNKMAVDSLKDFSA